MLRKQTLYMLAVVAAAALSGADLAAQDNYPSRPIKIVIGYPPGSGTDVTTRLIAQELQKELNQPIVVENRPGAAVRIASDIVKAAAPDGYTLQLTANSSHSVNPHVFKSLSYDPIADFTPIGGVAGIPFIVAINADLPVKSLPELVSWSQANRGKVFYGYSGTVFRVPGETLNRLFRMEASAVPFKGSPEAMTEVISGRVQFLVVDLASSQPHVAAKRLRALALTGSRRSALAPDLPTVEEVMRVQDFDMAAWTGMFGPANLPRPIVDKVSGALQRVLNRPDFRQRMQASNLDPMPLDPAAFGEYVKQQLVSWGKKVREAGIEPE
ncbi:MAG: Bug family tripartite tricarboxylate transporter substrate binding protein [Burkholderiales bacterium]